MTFLAPIAGVVAGAIGGAVVLLVWMLKLRRRPVRVSTTMLWVRVVRDMEGNVPWQMARPSVLLFLHLLIVALLALALARPIADNAPGVSGHAVMVIDSGASMGASGAGGETRLGRAIDRASALAQRGSGSARFTVIDAGTSARMTLSGSGSWREAREAIRSIDQSDAPSDLEGAIELARSVDLRAGEGEDAESAARASVYVLTDRDPGEVLAQGVTPIGVGEAENAGNLGIVRLGAQRDRARPALVRVFVSIGGVLGEARAVIVRAEVDGETLGSRAIELEGGVVEEPVSMEFVLDRAAIVRVSVSGGDALGADDAAYVEVPSPDPARVAVIAPGGRADPLLLDAIRAVTSREARVVGDAGAVGDADLIVFDRVGPIENIAIPTLSFVGGEEGGDGIERVLTWERDDPVMRDVDLGRVVFTDGAALETDGSDKVLARWRGGALIVERAARGVRHVRVGFALEDSNMGVQIALPALVSNAIERLLPGSSGSGVVRRAGEIQRVRATGGRVTITDPEGATRTIEPIDGVAELGALGRAGVYGLAGAATDRIGVSVLSKDDTRRAGRSPGGDADMELAIGGASMGGRVELWRWFALGALVLLAMEWTLEVLRRRV